MLNKLFHRCLNILLGLTIRYPVIWIIHSILQIATLPLVTSFLWGYLWLIGDICIICVTLGVWQFSKFGPQFSIFLALPTWAESHRLLTLEYLGESQTLVAVLFFHKDEQQIFPVVLVKPPQVVLRDRKDVSLPFPNRTWAL